MLQAVQMLMLCFSVKNALLESRGAAASAVAGGGRAAACAGSLRDTRQPPPLQRRAVFRAAMGQLEPAKARGTLSPLPVVNGSCTASTG
jgi:hypothetical protein